MDDQYERFLELLPLIYETASEVTTKETKLAIQSIVITEVGETEAALEYLQSFRIEELSQERKNVRFVAATERVKHMEAGVKSFSMKDKMLQPGKKGVKVSKKGYLYRTIPISKDDSKTSTTGLSSREREIRSKIRDVLSRTQFSIKASFKNKNTGEYSVVDQAPGIVRTRVYDSKEEFVGGSKIPKSSKVVLFRTMSSKPGTSAWIHPGIPAKNIIKKVQDWQATNEGRVFNETVDYLLETYFP
jgi:hypothetical protein